MEFGEGATDAPDVARGRVSARRRAGVGGGVAGPPNHKPSAHRHRDGRRKTVARSDCQSAPRRDRMNDAGLQCRGELIVGKIVQQNDGCLVIAVRSNAAARCRRAWRACRIWGLDEGRIDGTVGRIHQPNGGPLGPAEPFKCA